MRLSGPGEGSSRVWEPLPQRLVTLSVYPGRRHRQEPLVRGPQGPAGGAGVCKVTDVGGGARPWRALKVKTRILNLHAHTRTRTHTHTQTHTHTDTHTRTRTHIHKPSRAQVHSTTACQEQEPHLLSGSLTVVMSNGSSYV